jgi:lipopolysaccharide/colanic/teichoic acid biosynthesis glycosyltransferase
VSTQTTFEKAPGLVSRGEPRGERVEAPPRSISLTRARVKDAQDLVLATALLTLSAPLMLVVALAIKLDSRGPVFFVQERVGVRRRRVGRWMVHEPARFRFYKFRSMVRDADPSLHEAHIEEYLAGNGANGSTKSRFKLVQDPRVTRIGRLIRRTSIDELPQLFNVLKRQMSLVGPRPVPPYEGDHYVANYPDRFSMLPGLTGLWQVSGRCDVGVEDMARLDLDYVENHSLLLDLRILLRTVPAVLSGRGAG